MLLGGLLQDINLRIELYVGHASLVKQEDRFFTVHPVSPGSFSVAAVSPLSCWRNRRLQRGSRLESRCLGQPLPDAFRD